MNPYQENIDKVYFITDGESIKIGYTSEKINRRIHRISNNIGKKDLYALGYFYGTMQDEFATHEKFKESRIRPDREWFRPTEDLIDFIHEKNVMPHVYVEYVNGQVMRYDTILLA